MAGVFSTILVLILLCIIGSISPPLLMVIILIVAAAMISDATRHGKPRPSVEEIRAKEKERQARAEIAKERRDEMFERWGENVVLAGMAIERNVKLLILHFKRWWYFH